MRKVYFSMKPKFLGIFRFERGSESEFLVEFGAVGESSVYNCDDVGFGTHAKPLLGIRRVSLGADGIDNTHDVLVENVAQTAFLHAQTHFEVIARSQGGFEAHFEIGHDHVDAAVVQFGKLYAFCLDEFVTAVFGVVLIDGIVDNALNVAFVVANAHFENKNGFHVFIVLMERVADIGCRNGNAGSRDDRNSVVANG